jgi:hypothetical protein
MALLRLAPFLTGLRVSSLPRWRLTNEESVFTHSTANALNGDCLTNESFRVRVTLRLAVYRQSVFLGDNPLRLTIINFVFQLNTFGYSPYVTSSLTRGWVCRVQLLLVLASAVILRSESRVTHDQILLSQIRDSPNLEGQAPLFTSPTNRVAQLYPQAVGSLFVASYYSQGYGGGIRLRLHTELS